ncbi:MAG TPA: flagellin [Phenylobacterium sp.]|uniref:flagellin n=1 Tax=Phenylobacterium sp. TaxID=1871053 RepID=UPI002B49A877|nr:flagellin [Phenylobacterium sp.]HKR89885.1 flagellin [Phenylobacterium sp.]
MTVISTNTTANTALLYLNKNAAAQSQDIAQLSSGSRITSAKDDSSGLAIATGMKADASVLQQAQTNLSNGTAVLNTADGALSNISDILTRMKTLTAQAQSGSSSTADLSYINAEYSQLKTEIDDIAKNTTFNGTALLDGTSAYSTGVAFMVGTSSSDTIAVQLNGADTTTLGVGAVPIDNATDAASEMNALDNAITQISTDRANVGATLSRLSFRSDVINTSIQNLDAAKSAITDTDIAATQSKFSSDQTLTTAAISALSDANQMNQSILKLLQ